MTTNVLILCTHNSARSILGEAMLNHLAAKMAQPVRGYSAGSAPSGRVHPMAIEVLKAAGVDVPGLRSKSWDELSAAGAPPLDIVITVCDLAAAEQCPVYFDARGGRAVKVHWGYPDPSALTGGDDAMRRAFELTRQAIGYRMLQLLALPFPTMERTALQVALGEIARN